MSEHKSEPQLAVTRRKLSFAATMKAVLWSFIGIRKRSDYERDAAQLNPLHIVIAAILGVLGLIAILITIVKSVVG
jgi:hypothetical protein